MSDLKSIQRLVAVQAVYEVTINDDRSSTSIEEIIKDIIVSSQIKKISKIKKFDFAKEIYHGVIENKIKIDQILDNSLKSKINFASMDILLKSIFRSAIFEMLIKSKLPKKIVISEYIVITNRYFGRNECSLLNGVLDNLQET